MSKVISGTASNNNFNIQLRSNGASIKNPTAQSLPVTYNDLSGTIDGIRLYIGSGYVFTNYVLELQLELGSTKTDYITHAEQNISFPLAEGQVLAEGDYLADDGVHHVRNQEIVSGTTATFEDAKNNGAYLCNQKTAGNLTGKTITFDEEVTNAIVEYELANEVIEPYTDTQQTAWNEIKALRTYKNVTHISGNAKVEMTYVRDLQTVINNLSN